MLCGFLAGLRVGARLRDTKLPFRRVVMSLRRLPAKKLAALHRRTVRPCQADMDRSPALSLVRSV